MTHLIDDFIKEINFRTTRQRVMKIKDFMKAEDDFIKQNTVDIPEFLKPVEETFEYRFNKGIQNAIKNGNKFWELYDRALLQTT